jgi:hypothetical protein
LPVADIASRNINRSVLQEAGGACGDLGTFIPHAIGAMTVAGLRRLGFCSASGFS